MHKPSPPDEPAVGLPPEPQVVPMEGWGVLVFESPLHDNLASVSAYVRKQGGSENEKARERERKREKARERARARAGKWWHAGCSRQRVGLIVEGGIELS